uniref:Macrodomain effector MavL domain-containing protein n=1 Tax=Homalodisca liturata TaxID=320908 RepID=A0A1B6IEJ4_9HEMI
MPQYLILLSLATLQNLIQYKQELQSNSMKPGHYLQKNLDLLLQKGIDIKNTTVEQFLQLLLSTKKTICFAESEVVGDGSDWNYSELRILGEISIAMATEVYDNGVWGIYEKTFRTHEPPISATLVFTPGPLLYGYNFQGTTPDLDDIYERRQIDQNKYTKLIERRLLPVLLYINESAKTQGKKAIVVLPGIGCGAFAGKFKGSMGEFLNKALQTILEEFGIHFKNIVCVRFDPFEECTDFERIIQGVKYRVRRNIGPMGKSQLCCVTDYEETEGEFTDCIFYKVVAWDHVSLPGNDYFKGSRNTDDGVTGAATNSMELITNVKGRYVNGYYLPPEGYRTWEGVAKKHNTKLTVDGNVKVATHNGILVDLKDISENK